jgi:hypothetical protein
MDRRLLVQGIYYLLSLIAFGVIAKWFMESDGLAPGERTKGFLRMNDAPPPTQIRQVQPSADRDR